MSTALTPEQLDKRKKSNKKTLIIFAVLAGLFILGLFAPKGKAKGQASEQEQTASEAVATNKVTKAQYGEAWPFTVEEGYIDCVDYQCVVFRTNQGVYALNGTAKSLRDSKGERLFKDDMEIRAIDEKKTKELIAAGLAPEKATVYIMMPDFIKKGLSMCK